MSAPLLLDDRLAPVTSQLGFVQAPVEVVTEALVHWQQSVHGPHGAHFTSRHVSAGGLEQLLGALLPLTTREVRRFLLLPTASPEWTAYFDNGAGSSSAFPHLVALARRAGLRGVRAAAVPDTAGGRGSTPGGRYGATVFEVYGDSKAHLAGVERSVELINDGGTWRFSQDGPPLPFEHLDAYQARRAKDRFSTALLQRYLEELGLRAFDEDFYAPTGSGVLVEKHGRAVEGSRHLSLDDARATFSGRPAGQTLASGLRRRLGRWTRPGGGGPRPLLQDRLVQTAAGGIALFPLLRLPGHVDWGEPTTRPRRSPWSSRSSEWACSCGRPSCWGRPSGGPSTAAAADRTAPVCRPTAMALPPGHDRGPTGLADHRSLSGATACWRAVGPDGAGQAEDQQRVDVGRPTTASELPMLMAPLAELGGRAAHSVRRRSW